MGTPPETTMPDAEPVDAVIVDDTPPADHHHAAGAELVPQYHGRTELITGTPVEKIAQARDVANALNDVIVAAGLRTKVGSHKKVQADGSERWEDRYHVNVEGWQTLATLLGVALVERSVRPLLDPATGEPVRRSFHVRETRGRGDKQTVTEYDVDGFDWEVVVDAVKDGAVIATGSGLCSRTEARWSKADEYAVRSMAATRATSRAMKQAAAWVITLAGYSTTPAEEMPQADASGPEPTLPDWARPATPEGVESMRAAVEAHVGEARATAFIAGLVTSYGGAIPAVAVAVARSIAKAIPPVPVADIPFDGGTDPEPTVDTGPTDL